MTEKVFEQIDSLLQSQKDTLIVAVDGRCASGKTTLAMLAERRYDCNVFHIDDYFLRPEQRTSERLGQAGENIDHERFRVEVLDAILRGGDITYRKFSCRTQSLEDAVTVGHKRLNIVEGVYSMHKELCPYYNLTIFCDITPERQAERLKKRETKEKFEKFKNLWIPMEEKYFKEYDLRNSADTVIVVE